MIDKSYIYSNFSSYKFSEQFNIKAGFHLIQNQYNFANPNSKFNIGYELEFEYELSPNSIFSFQVSKINNNPNGYQNINNLNVP